jgi:hypothetical protein
MITTGLSLSLLCHAVEALSGWLGQVLKRFIKERVVLPAVGMFNRLAWREKQAHFSVMFTSLFEWLFSAGLHG